MKKTNQLLTFLLVTSVILSFAISGCQGKTNNGTAEKSTTSVNATSQTTAETTTQSANDVKKLVVWGGVPAELGPGDLINDWNTKHPDIQAEYNRFVNDDTGNAKLDTVLMAGEPIDVYFSYSEATLVKRTESGCAEELSQYGLDKFIEDQLGSITNDILIKSNSKLYNLPTNYTSKFIFINKKLFDEKGIAIPTEWTIDEFRAIAKKLTFKKSDGKMQYGTFNVPNTWQMKEGGDFWYKADGTSNFDDPAFKESLLLYKEMMDVDKSTFPYKEVLARNLQQYRQDVFMNGECAMMIDEGATIRNIKDTKKYPHDFVTAFAPTPVPEKGKKYNGSNALYFYTSPGVTYGNYIMINSKSTHKTESVDFIKYFITDGSIFMASAGKIPIYKNTNLDNVAKKLLGPDEATMKLFDVEGFKRVAFDKSIIPLSSKMSKGLVQITSILKEEADKYYLGYQTIDQCAESMKKRADAAIKAAQ